MEAGAENMEKVIITGATGFVGRRLLKTMLDQDIEVMALVREPEALASVESKNLEVREWHAGDALDSGVFEGWDSMVHMAAYLPANYSDPSEAGRCLEINALATLELLRQSAEAGLSKFVYVSSGNIYRPGEDRVSEDFGTYPSWRAPYYLSSKLVGEIFSDHFGQSGAIESTIVLRPSAIYGPGMGDGGVVPLFAKRLLDGEPIELSDGGRHQVDLVYVDDVVQAIDKALNTEVSGQFNVGSGERHTILELAEGLLAASGAARELMTVHPTEDGDYQPGFSGLDVSRAKQLLGYQPTTLRDGLQIYIEYLQT